MRTFHLAWIRSEMWYFIFFSPFFTLTNPLSFFQGFSFSKTKIPNLTTEGTQCPVDGPRWPECPFISSESTQTRLPTWPWKFHCDGGLGCLKAGWVWLLQSQAPALLPLEGGVSPLCASVVLLRRKWIKYWAVHWGNRRHEPPELHQLWSYSILAIPWILRNLPWTPLDCSYCLALCRQRTDSVFLEPWFAPLQNGNEST